MKKLYLKVLVTLLVTMPLSANATLLQQVSPAPTVYDPFTDYRVEANGLGLGTATGLLQAVDLLLPPGPVGNSSTSGCESTDFDFFTAGSIALLQRGACTFELKVFNAFNAGAIGALIFNEGQVNRTEAFSWTCISGLGSACPIPSLMLSYDVGSSLAAQLASGQRVVIEMTVEGVPAPGTFALTGLAFALLYRVRRRRV